MTLIERLRTRNENGTLVEITEEDQAAAADAIEALQAENERLKEEAKQWQSLSELSLGMAEAHSKERDALAAKLAAVEADAERLKDLLSEVSSNFTREDDLPDGLLGRIDIAIDAAKGGQHEDAN